MNSIDARRTSLALQLMHLAWIAVICATLGQITIAVVEPMKTIDVGTPILKLAAGFIALNCLLFSIWERRNGNDIGWRRLHAFCGLALAGMIWTPWWMIVPVLLAGTYQLADHAEHYERRAEQA